MQETNCHGPLLSVVRDLACIYELHLRELAINDVLV